MVLSNVLFSFPKPPTTLKHGHRFSCLSLPPNVLLLLITPLPLFLSMFLYKTIPHNKPTNYMLSKITSQYDRTTKLNILLLKHNQTTNTINIAQIKTIRWILLHTINKNNICVHFYKQNTTK